MNELTEVTRREIVDYITTGVQWSGQLSEDQFLARIYDLASMPSNDGRFKNAIGDIRQHRVNWSDWPDEWVFLDERSNIIWAAVLSNFTIRLELL